MTYWIFHFFFRIFFESFLSLKTFDREKIPSTTGYIVASNHLSNLDPMLLGVAANRRFSFLAKKSLFRNKFFGGFLSAVGAFPIKRGGFDARSIREALKRLEAGGGLVMFPQGGRGQREFDEQNIKHGIGMIATKANVPVVPAFIVGSDEAMPAGSKSVKRAKVQITFGDPIFAWKGASYSDIAIKAAQAIKSLSK